jgi:acyl carrier protein
LPRISRNIIRVPTGKPDGYSTGVDGHVVETIVNDYITQELVQDNVWLPLDDATSLIETGILHSLSMLSLAVFIQERFGVTVEDADLVPANFDSVDAICAYLRARDRKEAGYAGIRG